MIINAGLILLTLLICVLVGSLLAKSFLIPHRFFLGLLAITIFAGFWSLMGAISISVRWGALMLLTGSLWWQRKWLAGEIERVYQRIKRRSAIDGIFYLLSFLVVAYASAATIGLYDTGLYHTQNIKWIESFPVVPGLGNLHGRFAFNSHFFLPNALLNFRFEKAGETVIVYPINAAAVWVVLTQLYEKLKRTIAQKDVFKTVFFAIIYLFVVLLYPSWLNAPSPDILVALIVIQVLMMVLQSRSLTNRQLLFLAALIAWSITCKLSNALLVLMFIPVALQHPNRWRKIFWGSAAIGTLVILPFLARNAVLSGYLIYPFSAIDVLPVDWKIPAEVVAAERTHIASWAKIPRQAVAITNKMSVAEWVPLWWGRKSMPFKILLGLNLLSFASVFFSPKAHRKNIGIISAILAINLVFWFVNAPDPRFVHGFLIFNAGLGLAIWATRLKFFPRLLHQNLVGVGTIVLALLGGTTIMTPHNKMVRDNLWMPAVYPNRNEIATFTSPFLHYVPVGNNRCFDADLPCLPEENENVVMRGTTVSDGFKTINQ